jgi:hypothetical protein
MKRLIKMFFLILLSVPIWYGESRSFEYSDKGNCVTVWRTYNNICYVIPGRYFGLLAPSSGENFIRTTNTSMGVDLIWVYGTKTVLAQIDSDSQIINNNPNKTTIINYNTNESYNDSVYTYFDNTIKVRRYKKHVNFVIVPIDNMGAL